MTRRLALLAALLASACGREAEAPAEGAAPASAPVFVAPAGPPAQKPSGPAIALDAEGLRLVEPATGSARAISFETPAAQVLALLRPLRGDPPERSTNAECGAGPLAFADWTDGLQLVFSEDRFVGWSLDEPGLTTMSGLGVGSTRAELEGAYAARIGPSTLGAEFSAGGLGGLLSGPGKDARVTTLWAGTICAFR